MSENFGINGTAVWYDAHVSTFQHKGYPMMVQVTAPTVPDLSWGERTNMDLATARRLRDQLTAVLDGLPEVE